MGTPQTSKALKVDMMTIRRNNQPPDLHLTGGLPQFLPLSNVNPSRSHDLSLGFRIIWSTTWPSKATLFRKHSFTMDKMREQKPKDEDWVQVELPKSSFAGTKLPSNTTLFRGHGFTMNKTQERLPKNDDWVHVELPKSDLPSNEGTKLRSPVRSSGRPRVRSPVRPPARPPVPSPVRPPVPSPVPSPAKDVPQTKSGQDQESTLRLLAFKDQMFRDYVTMSRDAFARKYGIPCELPANSYLEL